jgi:hypothetical protein
MAEAERVERSPSGSKPDVQSRYTTPPTAPLSRLDRRLRRLLEVSRLAASLGAMSGSNRDRDARRARAGR